MCHPIRDGVHHAGHHVAHIDIGHEAPEQERVAVAHRARQGAALGEQPLSVRDMYVPRRH